MKKIMIGLLALVMATGGLAGCGGKKADDGKLSFEVAGMRPSSHPNYKNQEENVAKFRELHPDWDFKTNDYAYNESTFTTMAMAKQLPTCYKTYFTEISKITKNGYAREITDVIKEAGIYEYLNEDVLKTVSDEDGKVWGLPRAVYAQALCVNKKLFEEAGLLNEDGTAKTPQTWDEVIETSKIIREKTGQAGFVFPTTNNCGGWHLMNVAWSYGTEFMKKDSSGKWISTFDSDEFKQALKWLKAMKWEANAFPENTVIDKDTMLQYVGTYQGAMCIESNPAGIVLTYGTKKEDVAADKIPAGPKGRISQMGGEVYMFSPEATDEQCLACLEWLKYGEGMNPVITEQSLANAEKTYQNETERGNIILAKTVLPMFKNRDGEEKLAELRQKYCNVDMKNFDSFLDFSDVTLHPEEPVCCQELYSILDGVVQAVMTNKDVDIDALSKKASDDFQINHLDKIK